MSKKARKPTALRALEGGRSHSLKKPEEVNEPKPDPRAPVCPGDIDAEAKRTWNRLAPSIERLGLLTQIDGDKFAGLCQVRSRLKAIWTEIKSLPAKGKSLRVTLYALQLEKRRRGLKKEIKLTSLELKECELREAYLMKEERKYMEIFRKYAADFGLSPRDRVGLSIGTDDGEENKDLLTQ